MTFEIIHRHSNGTLYLLKDMTIEHLRNTIKYLENKAQLGVRVFQAEIGFVTVYGEEAQRYLNIHHYKAALRCKEVKLAEDIQRRRENILEELAQLKDDVEELDIPKSKPPTVGVSHVPHYWGWGDYDDSRW